MDRYIRLILVERDGALVGIVSAHDLLGVYSANVDLDFGLAEQVAGQCPKRGAAAIAQTKVRA